VVCSDLTNSYALLWRATATAPEYSASIESATLVRAAAPRRFGGITQSATAPECIGPPRSELSGHRVVSLSSVGGSAAGFRLCADELKA
jgi:hypothetical protein